MQERTVPQEPPYLYLTTTGRRSGRPHQIEIWFTTHEGRCFVISERAESADWVRNLRREPRVTISVGSRDAAPIAARARVLAAGRERALWDAVRARSVEKYGWGDGLVVEIEPSAER
ncbi:MAG: hypothetical protein CL878_04775 [Dehalococcoidia bacterium]|nr:hypothetical protein [Dehalococcoidia bacterium]